MFEMKDYAHTTALGRCLVPVILTLCLANAATYSASWLAKGDGIDATSFESAAIQADGKIVAAGTFTEGSTDHFAVIRYKPDGSLDPVFGKGGFVILPSNRNEKAFAMELEPDGKIVVAGYMESPSSHDVAVVRLNTDGSLDMSFGKSGKVTTRFGQSYARAFGVFVQPDGKIVVVGHSNNRVKGFDFSAVRYNPDGTLDLSFGKQGIAETVFGTQNNGGQAGALQSDGKIIVVGQYSDGVNASAALMRYKPNGILDETFGRAGKVITPYPKQTSSASRVVIQPNGKIIAAGYAYRDISLTSLALSRYLPNGTADLSFGVGGKLITPGSDGASVDLSALRLAADGKIIAAGKLTIDYQDRFFIRRYEIDGKPDLAFGHEGSVATACTEYGKCEIHALAVQSDGRIVAVGFSELDSHRQFAIARYKADGSLDTSFGREGMVMTSLGPQ
jgi:uncharacterized delta-60 repeat protein